MIDYILEILGYNIKYMHPIYKRFKFVKKFSKLEKFNGTYIMVQVLPYKRLYMYKTMSVVTQSIFG